jgi:hypothetical protein
MNPPSTLSRQLIVTTISATQWRVSDPERHATDALPVVGFVQQLGDTFETTRIGQPFLRRYFRSLRDAVTDLAGSR